MFNKKKKAARVAAKAKANADAAAKKTALKKAVINKIVRPGAKPVGPGLVPVVPAPHGKSKRVEIVKIHMLGNALIDGTQYMAGKDYSVPMSTYKAIGTSCVSTAKWRAIQAKGGIGSLHK